MCNIFDIFIALAGRLNTCCVDSVWGFFARHIEYMHKLEENLDGLKNAIAELEALKEDLMRRVVVAEGGQGQLKRLAQVRLWFDQVKTAVEEGDALLKKGIQEVRRLCLGGYCSVNCWTSSNVGKMVDKSISQMTALKDRGERFGVVAEEALTEVLAELPCDATIGMEEKFNQVWNCLEEKDVGIIGLYGIGGVGKTTLLTQIRNKLVDSCNNLLVIWVVVGRNSNLEKIQADIGKEIGVLKGPAYVYNKLLKEKFVLLLDDIWERIELQKIGIPPREKLNGSKIFFTTRSLKVCGEMLAQRKVRVETLEWKYAWELFKQYAGEETILDNPEILPLAENVAQRCAGLPIALISIGRVMSYKTDPGEWHHALDKLKTPANLHLQTSEDEVFNELKEEVFSLLKFSYDSLPNDKIKSCFLYCALFPEDFLIEKSMLVDYWIYEDMWMDGHELKGYNEGYSIMGKLIHACLLEEEGDFVKVHDVIRDMALWIQGENALVMANMGLVEAPTTEKWEGVRRLSLMYNKIEKLMQVPECPKLETLVMNYNFNITAIHEDFFQFMSSLTILNLSASTLANLPRSIANLVSLRYLDISSTRIEVLPIELGKLHKLKCFRLIGLRLRAKKSDKVLSCLSSLQALNMLSCENNYQEEETGERKEREKDALISTIATDDELVFDELLCLKHLKSLGITLRSSSTLQRFLSNHEFMSITESMCLKGIRGVNSFNISLLVNIKYLAEFWFSDCDFEEIQVHSTGTKGAQEICRLQLKDINFNYLKRVLVFCCDHLRDLTWLIFIPNLANLSISMCPILEKIIDAEKLVEIVDVRCQNLKPFSRLDSVSISNLPQLNCIYPTPLPLLLLTKLSVSCCPLLKKLPLDSSSKLGRKIRLRAKKEWWEAIEWVDDATKAALLPRFKFLLY